MPGTFILTLNCPQRAGIVHAVTAFLFAHGCDIVEHQQFDDPIRGALFLRTEVLAAGDADAPPSRRRWPRSSGWISHSRMTVRSESW
jgi:formyltetrahydrofolate hydrolase